MATIDSGILQTITPVTHDLGDFKVRRTLPAHERTMVGPFIFVDQFGPARLPAGQGMDVRPHPHINLATVTYLFEGAIEHRDSLGTHQVIEPGAVNLMTAGKRHRPFRTLARRARAGRAELYGMQTWLALPDGREEIDPAFDHVAADGLPLIEGDGASARVLMGTLWGATAGDPCIRRRSTPTSSSTRGGSDPDRGRGRRARGDAGRGRGDARRRSARAVHALCPRARAMPRGCRARAAARLMLLGGEAFSTPRYVWWNFVCSSRDRINQAKEDWQARRFPLDPRRRRGVHPAARACPRRSAIRDRRPPTCRCRPASRSTSRSPAIRPKPAVILLHGFPESHRTWREVAPLLEDKFHLIMPDQRGFAGSDRPQEVDGLQDRHADRRHFRAGRCARRRAVRAGRSRLGRRDRLGGGASRRPAARRGSPSSTRPTRSSSRRA